MNFEQYSVLVFLSFSFFLFFDCHLFRRAFILSLKYVFVFITVVGTNESRYISRECCQIVDNSEELLILTDVFSSSLISGFSRLSVADPADLRPGNV